MVDRRALVLAGTGLLLAGCGTSSGSGSPRGDSEQRDRDTEREGDREILTGLLQLEQQSVALYSNQHGDLFRRLEAHEREHAQRLEAALRRRGGRPRPSGWMTGGSGTELARKIEETAIAAYLDALPKVVDPKLRGLLATIVAAEASHLAEVRRAQGLVPADRPFVTGRREL